MPVLLVAAGIALLILNRSFRADLSNDLRSAIVFVGASLLLAGVAVLFARLFSAGNPYYPAGRCYLRYEELFFEIYEKKMCIRDRSRRAERVAAASFRDMGRPCVILRFYVRQK